MSPLHFDCSNMRQILLQAVIIVCFGIGIGLMFNYPVLIKAFKGEGASGERLLSEPASMQGPRPVLLEEIAALQGKARLIDARIPELYVEGHLPGALSLPYSEISDHLESFMTQVAKGETLVIYCSGYGCPDSFDLALLLQGEGFTDVRVFEGGFPQWRDAGNPIETGLP
jgi:rhodanese-related sulfurtransferase